MTGYNLLENYTDNSEVLLRKNRFRTASSSTTPLAVELVTPIPSATIAMAKTLYDYSTPTVANMPIGPTINTGARNFELRSSMITMVQANQSMVCLARTQVHTRNTFWCCATPSSSKMSHQIA
jgi:hypothetical protein